MFKEFADYIKEKTHLDLVIHKDPDGDAIGSALALRLILKEKGIDSDIYCQTMVSTLYNFLSGFSIIKPEQLPHANRHPSGIVTLDSAAVSQIGQALPVDVNIDHHLGNPGYGALNIIVPEAAATGEIIFTIAQYLDVRITHEMAQCLYVALSTDTGHFKYANTSEKSFEIACKLVRAGVNPSQMAHLLYEQLSFEEVQTIGQGLSGMQQAANGKIVWSFMRDTMDLGPRSLIDCIREVECCEVAVVFKQRSENETKVSLRSKSDFDVRVFAEQFGGGGHPKAAGITVDKDLKSTERMIIDALTATISV